MHDRRARSVVEIPVMPQPKDVPQRKRRRKGVPVLGAAGLSLSLASGASAAVGGVRQTSIGADRACRHFRPSDH